jgi:DNA repair protein RadA/Sms
MAKHKNQFICNACGSEFPQWAGKCSDCGAWNSLQEQTSKLTKSTNPRQQGFSGQIQSKPTLLADVPLAEQPRLPTLLSELDRVLGGGLVPGSVVLLGGDPGIGKSTLLLQTISCLSETYKALYVTGEESMQQVTLRARRLSVPQAYLQLLTETQVENIIAIVEQQKPQVLVVDSIQTLFTELSSSAPGSVSQIRESAAQLVQLAKQYNIALFLVGHVTKEGHLAGPRVLEHMVDTVLYFEGERDNRFRVIRAIKNRFGAVNELGVFAMTDTGLKEVNNPSAIFLSRYKQDVAGSCIMVTWEGSRPLLVEIQALVDYSQLANPRRVTVGLEHNRLAMLLAVLHRHGGIATADQDVFINVVGGLKVTETAVDLALLLAIISSLKDQPLPPKLIVFGEVGLAGEIRPVQSGQERIREAYKHGFTQVILPRANMPKKGVEGMTLHAVDNLQQALQVCY